MKTFKLSEELILEFDNYHGAQLVRMRKVLGSVIILHESDWSALVELIRSDLPPELELPWLTKSPGADE